MSELPFFQSVKINCVCSLCYSSDINLYCGRKNLPSLTNVSKHPWGAINSNRCGHTQAFSSISWARAYRLGIGQGQGHVAQDQVLLYYLKLDAIKNLEI